MKLEYIINKNDKFNSVNDVLINHFNISSRLRTKLITNKMVCFNGNVCDTRNSVSIVDIVKIDFDYEEDSPNIVPTKMDLDIIFEDEWLLVVNKPAGIAVHPSILHYEDSLCKGVKFYFDSIGLK